MKELFHPYKADFKLLTKLGLPLWEPKLNEVIYLGEVYPYSTEREIYKHKNLGYLYAGSILSVYSS